MAFSVKTALYNLLPKRWIAEDTYKDGNGKGFIERYNEALGEDFDEYYLPLIENLPDNTINPETAEEKFIPYLEELPGAPFAGSTIAKRRKLIKYATRYKKIRCTKKAIELLIKLHLGKEATLTPEFPSYGFDSDTTWDDPVRTWDIGKCPPCMNYSIAITGTGNLTQNEFDAIFRILEKNQPYNAKIKEVTYNGDPILPYVITMYIDWETGELKYDNANDPELVVTLVDGVLYFSGPRAQYYTYDPATGNLIFTI